jgi:hypothetical protein
MLWEAGQTYGPRLPNLIERPQPWLVGASADTWAVLGQLAAIHGLWEPAERAFLNASERPGADEASLLAKAAEVAEARGDSARRIELIADARSIEAAHPEVILADAREIADPKAQLDRLQSADPKPQAKLPRSKERRPSRTWRSMS